MPSPVPCPRRLVQVGFHFRGRQRTDWNPSGFDCSIGNWSRLEQAIFSDNAFLRKHAALIDWQQLEEYHHGGVFCQCPYRSTACFDWPADEFGQLYRRSKQTEWKHTGIHWRLESHSVCRLFGQCLYRNTDLVDWSADRFRALWRGWQQTDWHRSGIDRQLESDHFCRLFPKCLDRIDSQWDLQCGQLDTSVRGLQHRSEMPHGLLLVLLIRVLCAQL